MFLSCSRVDERRCSLGGKTRTESEEKRYLQRTKKDFCEAMRKLRQDVAVHRFAHHKTACLLTLSPLACHEAACSEPIKRRFRQKSGRRGSNPRQPAWKAGTLPTELLPHSYA